VLDGSSLQNWDNPEVTMGQFIIIGSAVDQTHVQLVLEQVCVCVSAKQPTSGQ
jgi:hypothetical protein